MKKMKKKEKLLRRDLIECKILNCIDNAKACYCSQAGLWRGQAAAKRMSSAQLIFQGLFTQNLQVSGTERSKRKELQYSRGKISRGTENKECLDWIAEETDGVTLSTLFGYKRGAFWPVPVEVKV